MCEIFKKNVSLNINFSTVANNENNVRWNKKYTKVRFFVFIIYKLVAYRDI